MDYFDRQTRIENWNQDRVSQTTALCLGVGGLGSVVAIGCVRLGLKKIILIDYDTVDYHNLNRQVCFKIDDIGKSKVQCAKTYLESHHNIQTTIDAYNLDIIKNWSQVVQIAQEANVVFNMIDYGDYFDLAAQSLCLSLNIPLIQGGTFAYSFTIDFFTSPGNPCLGCANDGQDKEIIDQITPDKIQQVPNLEFLPRNDNPIGQSNVYLGGLCGLWMTSILGQYLINDPEIKIPNRLLGYTSCMEMLNFNIESKPGCQLCNAPEPEPKEPEQPKTQDKDTQTEDLEISN